MLSRQHFTAFFPPAHSWDILLSEFPGYRGSLSTFMTLEVNKMTKLYLFKIYLFKASCFCEDKLMLQTQYHTLYQQRRSCWAGSTALQAFPSDEWDTIINEWRPLARCIGSLRANHNHSTFIIKPQFICKQTATLDGQIAQGYWMKNLPFMSDNICPSVFSYLIEKYLAYSLKEIFASWHSSQYSSKWNRINCFSRKARRAKNDWVSTP